MSQQKYSDLFTQDGGLVDKTSLLEQDVGDVSVIVVGDTADVGCAVVKLSQDRLLIKSLVNRMSDL